MEKNYYTVSVGLMATVIFAMSVLLNVAQYMEDPIDTLETYQNSTLCRINEELGVKTCYAVSPFEMIEQDGVWRLKEENQ